MGSDLIVAVSWILSTVKGTKMKAILCQELTGFENLTHEEVDIPRAGRDEVLVKVNMVALNFFDTLITQGKYQIKPDLPFSPGGEVAGVVVGLGQDVDGFCVGDRVMAYIGWGGLQEQIVVARKNLIKIPGEVSDEVAASLMITYGTAMHGLVDRAQLKKGETIAVLGAGGGAGLAAVQIACALGAHVIAVASSEEKRALVKQYGAHDTIDSEREDLKACLKTYNQGRGVDVIYDCVGGDLAEPALRALAWNGRYLVVGFASGTIPSIALNLIMLKGIHVQGVFFGRYIEEQREDFKNNVEQLLRWVQAGALAAHIHAVYPLSQVKTALGDIANRTARGKVLVKVSS